MADLGELRDYLNAETLQFSINGTQYAVTPTAEQVLRFSAAYAATNDFTEPHMLKLGAQLMGGDYSDDTGFAPTGVVQEMIDNGVDIGAIFRVCYTVILWVKYGEDTARTYWQTGDMGKALGLNQPQGQTAPVE